ncbi:MAG TPA: gliding motility-associated C-terminal domain-containing protein [Bacteroidales bacterium]|nr:gliding motility-associated C-terminal domain-containing protein [Bacteroidales bacterium]
MSQTRINGIINQYGKVTSLGTDYVVVDDAARFSQFSAGDTVLLIQMKGVRIYVDEGNVLNGDPQDEYGEPGLHEFLIIQSVQAAGNKIIFKTDIANAYNINGTLQIIKVPSYNSAVVDGSELTCAPWDSTTKTGGVLAMIVGKTLSLNQNINVSGKGFKGGATSPGEGLCVSSDVAAYDKYSFNSSSAYSGFKGEGPVTSGWLTSTDFPAIFPGYAKGKGKNLTGGGGGNGRFSGGGGGSNYGRGGNGGYEDGSNCSVPVQGGLGGIKLELSHFDGRIFLGGGGGSSTYVSGSTASAGGNGGGIVIILCDTLKGNGKSILADGASSLNAGSNAGAGGGGGGGTIAVYLQSFSSTTGTSALTISAKGGNGGNNPGGFGHGGGGGGGFINVFNVSIPANVTIKATRGNAGGSGATAGADGDIDTTFVPILNGFLFNSVISSISGTQVDSICSNVVPKELSGTLPVGGSGSYTYLWQKSYDLSGPVTDIPSSNSTNYTPSDLESDTVWFRRIVKDDLTALTDISKWVEIRVQTAISGNLVGKDTTICYNQDPLSLIPLNSGPSNGNGFYTYRWIRNLNNTDWLTSSDATGTNTGNSYDPSSLTQTTYFKRIVTSGMCVDYSPAVTVNVLPSITGNITERPDSVICEGSLFKALGASAPAGGNLTYNYLWQDSTASGAWATATGTNDAAIYNVDTATFSIIESRYFRRVVFSGPDSVCRINSSPIRLTRYHKILNNSILADQTICSGSAPAALTGSAPLKGSLAYTYQWQDSSKVTGSWTTKGITDFSFSPSALTDTTWYRRIVNSSKCADTSLSVKINVHKPILNNVVSLLSGSSDTTICIGAIPHMLKGGVPTGGTGIPGDYAYQWLDSVAGSSWNAISSAGTGINYQPPLLAQTTYYKRQVISGSCTVLTNNYVTVTVLPLIANNIISSSQTVCYNTVPALLTGATLSGGSGTYTCLWEQSTDGVIWAAAGGTNNTVNYQPPVLTEPVKYRRIVKSGEYDCCSSVSNVVSIGIYVLPTGTITNTSDTTICEGSKINLNIHLTGQSKWEVIYKDGSSEGPVRIAAADTTLSVSPVTGTALSSLTYSLEKVTDGNGCVATLLTGTKKADVYKVPVAEAGDAVTLCGAEVIMAAVPSYGVGTWSYPSGVISISVNNPSTKVITDSASSAFSGGNYSLKLYWEETNWQCRSKDSVTVTFDKRVASVNAGADTILYTFDNAFTLDAAPVTNNWERGEWSPSDGIGDVTQNNAEVLDLKSGLNTYVWTVTNGTCSRSDSVTIDVKEIFIPEGFSPNGDGINDTFIVTGMNLDNPNTEQDAELTIVNSAGTKVFYTTFPDGQEDASWDGKNEKGQDLPEGTYYYLLKMTSKYNSRKWSGFIVLKRY